MSTRSDEARLLAHEALLKALLLTLSIPKETFAKFTDIYTTMVRDLNKTSPDNAQLAKDVSAECGRFTAYLPK